jgi:DNA replication initiation complex subunit (GINS family)
MAEPLDYKKLRDLIREEKASPGLVKLPNEFMASLEAFLSSKFSEMEETRSILQMKEFENAVGIVREMLSIRQQKILFKAIRSGGSHEQTEDMTESEHALYDRFAAVIAEERERLDEMLGKFERRRSPQQAGAAQPQPEQKPPVALKRVRFVKEVPAYVGQNNETFGPFKAGEEGQLPPGEADWLLKGKLAETVD